jgi:hypothetical protein
MTTAKTGRRRLREDRLMIRNTLLYQKKETKVLGLNPEMKIKACANQGGEHLYTESLQHFASNNDCIDCLHRRAKGGCIPKKFNKIYIPAS